MFLTLKNTVLTTLLAVFAIGSVVFFAPMHTNAAYDDLPAYVKNQLGEMRDYVVAQRDAYTKYRDSYLAAKANWQLEREEVRGAITDVRSCKGDPSPPCDFVRNDFVDAQKAFMGATVARLANHLDNVDTYLIRHIDDATEQGVATAWVNEIRTDLADIQAKIDALSTASQRSDVQDIKAFTRDAFKEVRGVSSAIRGHYLLSTAKKTQEKFTALLERFKSEQAELEAEGVDTTKLATLITNYEANVSDIQGHVDRASALYQSIVDADSVDEALLKKASADFKDRALAAKTHYRNLLGAAKDVFRELHNLNNQ